MQLMLAVIFGFVLIGLVAPRFEGRQQVIIAGFALVLAFCQFFFPRFL
jgi:hypothetical protein